MKRGELTIREAGADYEIRIVGDRPSLVRDFYHSLLRRSWWVTIAAISGVFLTANALFGVIFLLVGGIAHAAPGSFRDAFFFSVQTMGTIGYGAMFPASPGANAVVVVEAIASLTLIALSTGLVFAKFSRSTARMLFSRNAVISPQNGVSTLMFRLGNQRGNQIVDAHLRVVMVRTERTAEGRTFYRMLDLPLTRGHALSLSRSWNGLHVIDGTSPLSGQTAGSLAEQEVELQVQLIGLDDITMQPVHAQHRYYAKDILWGHRLADVLSETADGHLLLDLRRFHDVEPVPEAGGGSILMFDAILFDNDGVLVDTEALYYRANRDALAQVGVDLDQASYIELFLRQGTGAFHLAAARGVSPDGIVALRAARDRRYVELVATENILIPGVPDLIRRLSERFRLAIVTSSEPGPFARTHARTGLLPLFELVLTRVDTVRAKPDPDPYLLAVSRLGLPPARCLVIEDSERGLRAAKAAGLTCWVVPSGLTRGSDFTAADAVLPDLSAAGRLLLGD